MNDFIFNTNEPLKVRREKTSELCCLNFSNYMSLKVRGNKTGKCDSNDNNIKIHHMVVIGALNAVISTRDLGVL